MTFGHSHLFVVASFIAAAVAGCNALLDNRPAVLDDDEAGVALTLDARVPVGLDAHTPRPIDAAAADVNEAVDGHPDVALGDAGADAAKTDAGLSCTSAEKVCFGTCVSTADPRYSCAASACSACSLPHATATCAGGECAILSCSAGFADCNQNADDGCETDLSQPAHCGSCNAVCATAAPLCGAVAAGNFACVNGCQAQAPTSCGSQCVNLTTSVNHCGQCQNACPVVPNGQVSCAQSTCRFTCDPGFHACSGRCVSNIDPATCGGRCTPCPTPANAAATCNRNGACAFQCSAGFHRCGQTCVSDLSVTSCGNSCTPCPSRANATVVCSSQGTCEHTCNAGFSDCDGSVVNGCEAALASDPNHCGACPNVCPGTACVAGLCLPEPPPPEDAGLDADLGL